MFPPCRWSASSNLRRWPARPLRRHRSYGRLTYSPQRPTHTFITHARRHHDHDHPRCQGPGMAMRLRHWGRGWCPASCARTSRRGCEQCRHRVTADGRAAVVVCGGDTGAWSARTAACSQEVEVQSAVEACSVGSVRVRTVVCGVCVCVRESVCACVRVCVWIVCMWWRRGRVVCSYCCAQPRDGSKLVPLGQCVSVLLRVQGDGRVCVCERQRVF